MQSQVFPLLNDHLEAAFKLTTQPLYYYKNRAYEWLRSIIEACPEPFWKDKKRRTVKSIYTHAVETAKITPEQDQCKDAREAARDIVIKFQEVLRSNSEWEDYAKVVQNSLLCLLATDKRE